MIDLHLHLDGSLTAENIDFLAKEQNITLPVHTMQQLQQKISVSDHCESLNEYLMAFDIPLLVLQSKEAISFAVTSLIDLLYAQHIRYAEIRFAPQLHTRHGLTQYEVVQAAADTVTKALKQYEGKILVNLILCCMRGKNNEKENLETVEIAYSFRKSAVCAIDLAGAEALYPTDLFSSLFEKASLLGVPYTIHAGEAAGPESVWTAIKFGAHRIGHGVQSAKDEKLMEYLAEKQIPLELCFTSNLQTKAARQTDFPLPIFLEKNICATINTDNMTVSDTTLQQEFDKLTMAFSLTEDQIKQLNYNAEKAAFLLPGQTLPLI